MLSRFPYPLEKGDKLRAYHQLKGLSKTHKIHLFCTVESEIKPTDFQQVNQYCESIHLFRLTKIGLAFQLLLSCFSNKPSNLFLPHQTSVENCALDSIHKT